MEWIMKTRAFAALTAGLAALAALGCAQRGDQSATAGAQSYPDSTAMAAPQGAYRSGTADTLGGRAAGGTAGAGDTLRRDTTAAANGTMPLIGGTAQDVGSAPGTAAPGSASATGTAPTGTSASGVPGRTPATAQPAGKTPTEAPRPPASGSGPPS
jgi:hypothetical protein